MSRRRSPISIRSMIDAPRGKAVTRREAMKAGGGAGIAMAGSTGMAFAAASGNPYRDLLLTWCEGLRPYRVVSTGSMQGGLLCPACAMVHGRSPDAIYPLLRCAHDTKRVEFVDMAIGLFDWGERNVSRADGSWVNDAVISDWRGITVFRAVTLAESLRHHDDLLPARVRSAWTDRLARSLHFLDGFITIDTGNINYPVSATYAFALGAELFGERRYRDRARALAHQALGYVTPNHLLFGEGHPQTGLSPRGHRPVDLGYNVEESLPALALYAHLTKDEEVADAVREALAAHLDFMLPDGGWDNSWGSRNYKWTWWGSRTSDGCHPAYRLFADRDPRFAEAADRNLALMRACTADGLLMGGPHCARHGYRTCLHHSFTHAKALATVLDLEIDRPADSHLLPADSPIGLRSYPEIGTHLAGVGEWRATFTDYDWDYLAPKGGGHATGGALSLLHHRKLGPVLVASMTRYSVAEPANQQLALDDSHQPLTPRIEVTYGAETYTNVADLRGVLRIEGDQNGIEASNEARLCLPGGKALDGPSCRIDVRITPEAVTLSAWLRGTMPAGAEARLILPVIASHDDDIESSGERTVIRRATGAMRIAASLPPHTPAISRWFNLVPGFECVPLIWSMRPDNAIEITVIAHGLDRPKR
jgi:hypothetical protein